MGNSSHSNHHRRKQELLLGLRQRSPWCVVEEEGDLGGLSGDMEKDRRLKIAEREDHGTLCGKNLVICVAITGTKNTTTKEKALNQQGEIRLSVKEIS